MSRDSPHQLTDVEFEGVIFDLLEEAFNHIDTTIRPSREEAWRRYYGKVDALPQNGGNDVVVNSIQDAADTIVPNLLDIFMTADAIAEFLPGSRDPVEAEVCHGANLAVTATFWMNDGWKATNDAVSESVISGYGFYKIFRKQTVVPAVREDYLSGDELLMAMHQSEVTELWDSSAPRDQQLADENFGKFQITDYTTKDDIIIEAVPASNMVWAYSSCFEDSWLIGQVTEVRLGDLVKLGFTPDELKKVASDDQAAAKIRSEQQARENHIAPTTIKTGFRSGKSWASTKVSYYELYVKVDRDGDGLPEYYCVWMAGDQKTIIRTQPVDEHPYIQVPAYRIPHSTYSQGLSERLKPFQEAETRVLRAQLDLAEMISGPMILNGMGSGADENKLSVWKSLKVVAVRSVEAIKWLIPPDISASLIQIAQEVKMRREDRSGVSRVGSSLRPEDMSDITATTTAAAMTSSQQKIEYLARLQAELAIKKVMQKILKLAVQIKSITVYLDGQPVQINSQNWDPGWNMRVKVGLGTGTRIERSMTLMNLFSALKDVCMQLGPDNAITDMARLNNLIYDYGCLQPGVNIHRYLKPVQETQQFMQQQAQQPPPPDPEMIKVQASIKRDDAKAQAKMQLDNQKLQSNIVLQNQKLSTNAQLQAQKLMTDKQFEQQRIDDEWELGLLELTGEASLERANTEINAINDRHDINLKNKNRQLRKPN